MDPPSSSNLHLYGLGLGLGLPEAKSPQGPVLSGLYREKSTPEQGAAPKPNSGLLALLPDDATQSGAPGPPRDSH